MGLSIWEPLVMFLTYKNNKKGISTIEILVVISIFVFVFTAFLGTVAFNLKLSNNIKQTVQANNLAQEAIEAVRSFRASTTWDGNGLGSGILISGNNYHPIKTGTPLTWDLVSGTETINGFTRKIVFENVNRDGNDNIIESVGTYDPDTKKVTVTVSWSTKQVEFITYFTNWRQ